MILDCRCAADMTPNLRVTNVSLSCGVFGAMDGRVDIETVMLVARDAVFELECPACGRTGEIPAGDVRWPHAWGAWTGQADLDILDTKNPDR